MISWADDIMGQYPDRKVILNTHSALNTNATLTDEGETLSLLSGTTTTCGYYSAATSTARR